MEREQKKVDSPSLNRRSLRIEPYDGLQRPLLSRTTWLRLNDAIGAAAISCSAAGHAPIAFLPGVKLEDTETLCNNLSVGNVGTLLLPATWWSCWRQPIQSRFLFDIDSQNAIISRRKRISRSFTNKSGGPPFNVRSTPIVLRKVSVTVHKIFPIRKAPSRFCSLSANGRRDCCWRNRSSKFRAPPGLISWENISSSAFQQRV
jgi:hypothetical protein